jgi:hypothetical protein
VISTTVIILSVYLVVILTIGFYSGRGAGKDAESFFGTCGLAPSSSSFRYSCWAFCGAV